MRVYLNSKIVASLISFYSQDHKQIKKYGNGCLIELYS